MDAARKYYEFLADVCESVGWSAYLPHKATDPLHHHHVTSGAVFDRDFHQLTTADVIVADIGSPSSGVGAELGIAFERMMPVIGLFRSEQRPSRFVHGMLERSRTSVALQYSSLEECRELLIRELQKLGVR